MIAYRLDGFANESLKPSNANLTVLTVLWNIYYGAFQQLAENLRQDENDSRLQKIDDGEK